MYLIEILHQTTTATLVSARAIGCILSKFYIKPQLAANLYLYSMSCILSKFYIKPQPENDAPADGRVVSYRNSTSNHNSFSAQTSSIMLYLIEILHQTTTSRASMCPTTSCILSKFYIKPQLSPAVTSSDDRCILSKFYIKPQRRVTKGYIFVVVSYRNSTSNHNLNSARILSICVVSYRNSTSNHNYSYHESDSE